MTPKKRAKFRVVKQGSKIHERLKTGVNERPQYAIRITQTETGNVIAEKVNDDYFTPKQRLTVNDFVNKNFFKFYQFDRVSIAKLVTLISGFFSSGSRLSRKSVNVTGKGN